MIGVEAIPAVREGAEAEVVHDGRGEQQVTIVGGVVQAPLACGDQLCEEEGAHAVVGDRGALRGANGEQRGLGHRAGREIE